MGIKLVKRQISDGRYSLYLSIPTALHPHKTHSQTSNRKKTKICSKSSLSISTAITKPI